MVRFIGDIINQWLQEHKGIADKHVMPGQEFAYDLRRITLNEHIYVLPVNNIPLDSEKGLESMNEFMSSIRPSFPQEKIWPTNRDFNLYHDNHISMGHVEYMQEVGTMNVDFRLRPIVSTTGLRIETGLSKRDIPTTYIISLRPIPTRRLFDMIMTNEEYWGEIMPYSILR